MYDLSWNIWFRKIHRIVTLLSNTWPNGRSVLIVLHYMNILDMWNIWNWWNNFYLQGKAFPFEFYSYLKKYLGHFCEPPLLSSDQTINLLHADLRKIEENLVEKVWWLIVYKFMDMDIIWWINIYRFASSIFTNNIQQLSWICKWNIYLNYTVLMELSCIWTYT